MRTMDTELNRYASIIDINQGVLHMKLWKVFVRAL
jgi:hypothetical protein